MTVVSDQAVQRIFGGARTGHALSPMPAASAVLDAILIAVAGTVGLLGRAHLTPFADAGNITDSIGVAGPIMLLGWLGAIVVVGGYRDEVYGAGADEYKRVLRATLLAAGLSTVVFYLAKFDLSRSFFLLTYGVGLPLLMIGRFSLPPRALRRPATRPDDPHGAGGGHPTAYRRHRPRAQSGDLPRLPGAGGR